MPALLLFALPFVLLQVDPGYGLPEQADLDLPILPSNYDPALRPPQPPPQPPPPSDDGDHGDEPAPHFYGEEISSESGSIVYVLDYSGSMTQGGRIDVAKEQMRRSLAGLPPTFRFNVVVYDCSVVAWSPATRAAAPEHKADAIRWLEALHPDGGGTATGPAVALALEEKENLSIVLLTDGDPNCGGNFYEGHRAMIRDANTQGALISVFGIDAWGEYRNFCLAVAADSGGSYCDVSTILPPVAQGE